MLGSEGGLQTCVFSSPSGLLRKYSLVHSHVSFVDIVADR